MNKRQTLYSGNNYEWLHSFMLYISQFGWYKVIDIWLCHTNLMDVRIWWHNLWVRPEHDHPSNRFDRDIANWYKSRYILAWDLCLPIPYEVRFIHRWREYLRRYRNNSRNNSDDMKVIKYTYIPCFSYARPHGQR